MKWFNLLLWLQKQHGYQWREAASWRSLFFRLNRDIQVCATIQGPGSIWYILVQWSTLHYPSKLFDESRCPLRLGKNTLGHKSFCNTTASFISGIIPGQQLRYQNHIIRAIPRYITRLWLSSSHLAVDGNLGHNRETTTRGTIQGNQGARTILTRFESNSSKVCVPLSRSRTQLLTPYTLIARLKTEIYFIRPSATSRRLHLDNCTLL